MKFNFILRELNPIYDTVRNTFDCSLRDDAMLTLNIAKSLFRGGVIGAGIGGIAAVVSGNTNQEHIALSVMAGFKIGAGIDAAQYSLRYLSNTFCKTYKKIRSEEE